MRKFLAVCFLATVTSAAPFARALEPGQVVYVGGTLPALRDGIVGKLDMTSETSLRFESPGIAVEIPYSKIESFEYSREVTHHLGVLPAVAVGLSKSRKHKHFFRISFVAADSSKQVVVLEVPKQVPPVLLAVLKTRSPEAYKNSHHPTCCH